MGGKLHAAWLVNLVYLFVDWIVSVGDCCAATLAQCDCTVGGFSVLNADAAILQAMVVE